MKGHISAFTLLKLAKQGKEISCFSGGLHISVRLQELDVFPLIIAGLELSRNYYGDF